MWQRRQQLGRELRDVRVARGLSQKQLAELLPNRQGGTGVSASWVARVEQQPQPSPANNRRPPLPQRIQLIMWARACDVDQSKLLERAKELLPAEYPERFIPQADRDLPQPGLEVQDWRAAGKAAPSVLVGRVLSLLSEGDGKTDVVVLTSMGPLMSALVATAGNGSVLDPIGRVLARHLASGASVRHLWSVEGYGGYGLDWLKLLRGLLTLGRIDGLYEVRAAPPRTEALQDVIALRGFGGLIILQGSTDAVTVPVNGPTGAGALLDYFDSLMRDHRSTELFRVFRFGNSPGLPLSWQLAMAAADEAPGWRMLVQPELGMMTVPSVVQARLYRRWQASCSDQAQLDLAERYQEALSRRRGGFELSLLDYGCYDVVSGAAFDRFVDSGTLREGDIFGGVPETPHDRLDHLDHLIGLLQHDNYNLAIVKRSDDMYSEIFSTDEEARAERDLHHFLLKERGGDLPSVFTSTYFHGAQPCAFEMRHPRVVAAYKSQAEAILANLAANLVDKAGVVDMIRTAMKRIARSA